ncbi:MAG: tRNA uridine-5-carboxymethylaminomethyl(34) synthesis GTPase MnmE [Acholeplasmataceae bacterium]|jgi:tRNA modification GTPase|nr:tRNA uridine-5-carboxymethylaminomethyl(34) synthesis GTPase MnmE [Acholeplasmataceae bacterium]
MIDNICAIATPFGTGGISVIRISGKTAISELNKIFKGPNLEKAKSHTIKYGHIVSLNGEILDEVMVSIFRAPRSFTAENVCEISTHGGVLVTQSVLNEILKLDVRLAEPGEFTQRAYLNGRIDLVQAEAVMDLIEAQNESALKIANLGLSKKTSSLVQNLLNKVLDLIAKIEVNIDYPEYDDAVEMTHELIKPILIDLIKEIEHLIYQSKRNQLIKDGINTAIVGRPNVGKSSLLNALLEEDRAIVTDISGTTRDLIEARLNLGGITLNLVDTAGIRDTDDIVESIGIDRSIEAIKKAQLVLLVLDQSMELTEEDKRLLELTKDKQRILIGNKSDLTKKIELTNLLLISSLHQEGLEELEKEIVKRLSLVEIEANDFNYLSNERQIRKITDAKNSLNQALEAIDNLMPVDLIAVDLSNSYYHLADILGLSYESSIIDELFSQFCLGK